MLIPNFAVYSVHPLQPIDNYFSNGDVCLLPTEITEDVSVCGDPLMLPMKNSEGSVGGNVTIFQTSDMRLFITYQMFCPFVLRSSVAGTNAPYSAALYVWSDLSYPVRRLWTTALFDFAWTLLHYLVPQLVELGCLTPL